MILYYHEANTFPTQHAGLLIEDCKWICVKKALALEKTTNGLGRTGTTAAADADHR